MMQIMPRQVGPSPISLARRVRRGFSRIGLVLALLVAVSGLYMSVTLSVAEANRAVDRYNGLSCLKKAWANGRAYADKYTQTRVDYEASGCPVGPYATFSDVFTFNPNNKPSWIGQLSISMAQGLGFSLIAIAIAFLTPWTIGWILSGFLGE